MENAGETKVWQEFYIVSGDAEGPEYGWPRASVTAAELVASGDAEEGCARNFEHENGGFWLCSFSWPEALGELTPDIHNQELKTDWLFIPAST